MDRNKKTAVLACVGVRLFGASVPARADVTFEAAWHMHFQTIVGAVRLHARY